MHATIFSRLTLLMLLFWLTACNSQTRPARPDKDKQPAVGGSFENREFTYYGIPKNFSARDTSPGWKEEGQKILLTGTIYQADGKTPAPGVLLYYYHTNTAGRYEHKPEEQRSMPPNEQGQTHGYIRGWVKTDSAGKYFIYTTRPGTYPTRDAPAHVHATIKEPNTINEYYIDDFVFDDDELVNTAYRKKMENRCGSGVVKLVQQDNLWIGERNIILGLHIPGYPATAETGLNSGLSVGEDVFSFIPYHAWGPDKGTRTCPVCKYGWYHGILYCAGKNPDWPAIKQWLGFLEKESRKREKYLKVYFVYGNEEGYSKKGREKELEKIGAELKLEKVALTFVPSFTDSESEVDLNKINPAAANTFILYKRGKVIDKFINLEPGPENFDRISRRLNETINEYFYLHGAEGE
ncbi:MAG TPA: hypothetical protein VFV31_00165 [Chitinophagaceae bacterium]|nr:hypothetical protein [Chitinophagaceae bacterium]